MLNGNRYGQILKKIIFYPLMISTLLGIIPNKKARHRRNSTRPHKFKHFNRRTILRLSDYKLTRYNPIGPQQGITKRSETFIQLEKNIHQINEKNSAHRSSESEQLAKLGQFVFARKGEIIQGNRFRKYTNKISRFSVFHLFYIFIIG